MCGRYYIEIDNKELQSIIAAVEDKTAIKTGEIHPTSIVPVLSPTGDMTTMHWGFPRNYGKSKQHINARSETATKRDTFRGPMIDGRCLIPASWYYEWEDQGEKEKKIKYSLTPGGDVMWMAGLSEIDSKTGNQRFVILTRPAWSGISFIHDRMPVILPKEKHDEWLFGHDPEKVMSKAINEVHYKKVET